MDPIEEAAMMITTHPLTLHSVGRVPRVYIVEWNSNARRPNENYKITAPDGGTMMYAHTAQELLHYLLKHEVGIMAQIKRAVAEWTRGGDIGEALVCANCGRSAEECRCVGPSGESGPFHRPLANRAGGHMVTNGHGRVVVRARTAEAAHRTTRRANMAGTRVMQSGSTYSGSDIARMHDDLRNRGEVTIKGLHFEIREAAEQGPYARKGIRSVGERRYINWELLVDGRRVWSGEATNIDPLNLAGGILEAQVVNALTRAGFRHEYDAL